MSLEEQIRKKDGDIESLTVDLISLFLILTENFILEDSGIKLQFLRPVGIQIPSNAYVTIIESNGNTQMLEYRVYKNQDYYYLDAGNMSLKLNKTITIQSVKSLKDDILVEYSDGHTTLLKAL